MLKKSQILFYLIILIVGFFVCLPAGKFFNQNIEKDPALFTASLLQSNVQNEKELQSTEELITKEAETELIEQVVLSRQDLLDDIQEKLDIINQKVQELIAENNSDKQPELADKEKVKDDENIEEDNKEIDKEETVSCTGQININTALAEDLDKIVSIGPVTAQKIILARPFYSFNDLLKVDGIGETTLQKIIEQGCAYVEPGLIPPVFVGGGGGSSVPIVYPKISISEVQTAGLNDSKEEFIELYNPSNQDIDLTNWYLQKKTSSGNISYFEKKSLFSGQKISAGGYSLIARSGYFASLADILVGDALLDNTSLILNNPNDVVSDEVSWAQIVKGLSWCFDFELCTPTPKAQNTAYVAPPPPPADDNGSNDIVDPPSPSIKTYEISNLVISEENPSTSIDLEFSEPVKYSIDILNSDGLPVKNIYKSYEYVKNPNPKIWDGKDNSGQTVVDGVYVIEVKITDSDGNIVTDTTKTITVDNILDNPPGSNDILQNIAE